MAHTFGDFINLIILMQIYVILFAFLFNHLFVSTLYDLKILFLIWSNYFFIHVWILNLRRLVPFTLFKIFCYHNNISFFFLIFFNSFLLFIHLIISCPIMKKNFTNHKDINPFIPNSIRVLPVKKLESRR